MTLVIVHLYSDRMSKKSVHNFLNTLMNFHAVKIWLYLVRFVARHNGREVFMPAVFSSQPEAKTFILCSRLCGTECMKQVIYTYGLLSFWVSFCRVAS